MVYSRYMKALIQFLDSKLWSYAIFNFVMLGMRYGMIDG